MNLHGFFLEHRADAAKDFKAADAFDRGICVWKKMANVRFASSSEKGISNGVAEHVGIRVTVEPECVWNYDPSEHQWAVGDEPVNIISNTGRDHSSARSIFVLEATIAYFSASDS